MVALENVVNHNTDVRGPYSPIQYLCYVDRQEMIGIAKESRIIVETLCQLQYNNWNGYIRKLLSESVSR